ncbi:Tumor necrosis factor receptor superfamily member 16 [Collichthys lucidus]|uniref:Tumor necrosis factor receptor superfamily member 16 n=1 Tax=Collichthys lucidus TaxID=240159 RepID=A0A4U5VU86_COLLU|nr:Tumor necrosis factor receptor superfamily member 16 [Collichthys lucidus]
MTTTLSLVIWCALVALVLASKTERSVEEPCDSGQYTQGGECCQECPPGEGVVKKCGATQTVCAQCLDRVMTEKKKKNTESDESIQEELTYILNWTIYPDPAQLRQHFLNTISYVLDSGETFSENYSHTEQCRPCTECTGLMRMKTPCTDSNDAICICNYNFFFNMMSGQCEPCTVCPAGQGVYAHCEHDHDTVCEECMDDTYSDRESYLDPCLPCTICDEETEKQLAVCTPTSDSVCHNPLLPTYFAPTSDIGLSPPSFTNYFSPEGSDSPLPGGETTTSSAGSPHFLGHGLNENLIPIYCSILAAVVVGLVAYIVFKSGEGGWWTPA